MDYADNLLLYTVFVFGIIVVPGMDMLFVLSHSLTGGRRSGLSATAGIMLGGAVHTLFGTLGVGLILAWAPALFTAMLYAGAAYMAWIGVTLLRSSITVASVGPARSRSQAVAFRQGLVTCLLNPKAYLFTMSVFPQFMKPDYGPLWIQALVIGAITVAMQLAVYGSLALAAASSRNLVTTRPAATILVGRAVGGLFILVAFVTVWNAATGQA
ncbi:threonine transporter RhtB [Aureimonas sp. SA4125]|uniref:LysE family translocator n=1 Tax=Aureimonas sp. SA4125 TaxID=2826993 RepID=UPI001CC7F927|nr:LysE family translocator [Aureimonas sp. SA4125]BDA83729.1 threonine transporter RhtB [Aureimonas sp. SA4125]